MSGSELRQNEEWLSIGDVARLAGIPPDTLRIWERRYGHPSPHRRPSGHRRYPSTDVRWLRQVAEALTMGHRAGKVLRISREELTQLLESSQKHPPNPAVEEVLEHVRFFRSADLEAMFSRLAQELGNRSFLDTVLDPLLVQVGRLWAQGELHVRHEHFLSEVLENFLRSLRGRMHLIAPATTVVLTTFPGESHALGMQMAAVLATMNHIRCEILGTETPIEEIVATARECRVQAILVSISLATGGTRSDEQLRKLRRDLDRSVRILVGGRGARRVGRGIRMVERVRDFQEFEDWLLNLNEERAAI